jgi:spermidine synthase
MIRSHWLGKCIKRIQCIIPCMYFIQKIKLEIIVFVSGAVVMILEIVGSRVYAPYLGASIYIWTSLIGIIMGSLSIGYYYGGLLADKGANYKTLARIIFLAGCFILLTNLIKHPILSGVTSIYPDPKVAALIAGLFLFVVPSILLGTVSPYAVKLGLNSLTNSGSTVGNLYAISTLGSIFGTFIAGFYLISYFGTTSVLYIISIILIVLSVFAYPKDRVVLKIFISLFCLQLSFQGKDLFLSGINGFIDVDTKYNRVWIYSDVDRVTQRPIKRMTLNRQNASAMFTDGSDLVFDYGKYYNLAGFFKPNLGSALLIGGAAYSYPKEFLKKFPEATLDVVEIDPDLEGLAKKYFNLQDNNRMVVYPEDGRVFLNTTEKKYDAVFVDAFNSDISIPQHLTTIETTKKIYDTLNEGGVVITNAISSIEGKLSGFYNAEFNTYSKVFPYVYVFKVDNTEVNKAQNLILIGLKSNTEVGLVSKDPVEDALLKTKITGPELDEKKILTDDYAPVESFFLGSAW